MSNSDDDSFMDDVDSETSDEIAELSESSDEDLDVIHPDDEDLDELLVDGPRQAVEIEQEMVDVRDSELREGLESFSWMDSVKEFKRKFDKASDQDQDALQDFRTAPRRVKDYFVINPKPKDELKDMILPFTLFFYGFALVLVSFFATGDVARFLTVPDRLADIYLGFSVLTIIAVLSVVYVRRNYRDSERLQDARRNARKWAIGINGLPIVLGAFVVFFFLIGNVEQIYSASESFAALRGSLREVLPAAIVGVGDSIWAATPLGPSILQVSILMTVLGFVGMIPFIGEIVKIFLLAVVTGVNPEIKELEMELEEDGVNPEVHSITGLDQSYGGESDSISNMESEVTVEVGEEKMEKAPLSFGSARDLMDYEGGYQIEPYDGYVEKKRYWLREPYSYAVILENEEEGDYRYYVEEPTLDTEEDRELYRRLRKKLERRLEDMDRLDPNMDAQERLEARKRQLEELSYKIAKEFNLPMTEARFHRVMYNLDTEFLGFGKIDTLMNDPNIEDISMVGPDQAIWIVHSEFNNMMTNIAFKESEAQDFVQELASSSGETISKGSPSTDATLPDGSRAQLTLGKEISDHGTNFTIRQFQETPFTPIDLIRTNTFTKEQMSYLWLAIQNGKSLIFAGGTASGKTTSMNAISLFIPPDEKVISLEDTREVELPHSHWIASMTRSGMGAVDDTGEVTLYDLLKDALRQRPEYLIVGEVRGEGALDLFQAMSTGHTAYSTMHASTVDEALQRLNNDPINVPQAMVQTALDIVCIQNRRVYDGEAVRRNEYITEIKGSDGQGGYELQEVFKFEPASRQVVSDLISSKVMKDIRDSQNWTRAELEEELERREKVMEYVIDNDIWHYPRVSRIIQQYMVNSDKIMQLIEDDELANFEVNDIMSLDMDDLAEAAEKKTVDISPGDYDKGMEELTSD